MDCDAHTYCILRPTIYASWTHLPLSNLGQLSFYEYLSMSSSYSTNYTVVSDLGIGIAFWCQQCVWCHLPAPLFQSISELPTSPHIRSSPSNVRSHYHADQEPQLDTNYISVPESHHLHTESRSTPKSSSRRRAHGPYRWPASRGISPHHQQPTRTPWRSQNLHYKRYSWSSKQR